jgi:hypothetical protein
MKSMNIFGIVILSAGLLAAGYYFGSNFTNRNLDQSINPKSITICTDELRIVFYSLTDPTIIIPDVTVSIEGGAEIVSGDHGMVSLPCCSRSNFDLTFTHPNYHFLKYHIDQPCEINTIFAYLVDTLNPISATTNNQIFGSVSYSDFYPLGAYSVYELTTSPPQQVRLSTGGFFSFDIGSSLISNLGLGSSSGGTRINPSEINDSTRIDVVMDHESSSDTLTTGGGF